MAGQWLDLAKCGAKIADEVDLLAEPTAGRVRQGRSCTMLPDRVPCRRGLPSTTASARPSPDLARALRPCLQARVRWISFLPMACRDARACEREVSSLSLENEAAVRRSDDRILTTHAGSLPRPGHLVDLYARRAHGEPVDPGTLMAAIDAATRQIVPKQLDAGIDIPNNGEQSREAFFLYVQHRMSGFGGRGQRSLQQDVLRYPEFMALRQRQLAGQNRRQQLRAAQSHRRSALSRSLTGGRGMPGLSHYPGTNLAATLMRRS